MSLFHLQDWLQNLNCMKNEKQEPTLIKLSLLFISILITVSHIIFWDCRVHFKFLLFFPTTLSIYSFHINCIQLTVYLQLHIFGNLLEVCPDGGGRIGGGGRCQLNEELINIQKLNYQNYMNSQIILADV